VAQGVLAETRSRLAAGAIPRHTSLGVQPRRAGNLVENAIRSPAMNRRNALFACHDEGGRNWARFASLIG